MNKSKVATKPSILRQFPEPVLNNTTINNLGASEDPIEIFPPEIFFKDIEPNQNYEVTVTVRNVTKKMRRIKCSQLAPTSKFHCDYENIGSIAAGLAVKMNMQFETDEEGNFHDMIEIHTEGHEKPYKLHLHALKPAPDVQFEPLINLKFIPIGKEKTEEVEFKNEGRITGHVNLVEEPRTKSGLIIEPSSFSIEPEEVIRVKIGMVADTADLITKSIRVRVEGQEDKHQTIEVTATCVEQHLSIVFEEGGGQKSSLNFGTLYMGERREYPAFLVNNGPQPAQFKFKFLQGLRNLDENYTDENDAFISPAEVGKELTDRVLTAEPLAGVVGPYQQLPISFICRTKKHDKKGGFNDLSESMISGNPASGKSLSNMGQQERYSVKPQDYASLAVIKFDEGADLALSHLDLKVQMMARTCYPDIKINRQMFAFGECPTNERRDMTLTIKNRSEDLTLDFNFTKIAHFRATPAKGKLLPASEHNINVSFEPKNFGIFSSEMQLEILKGIYKVPIKIQGSSNSSGIKGRTTRGPAAKLSDFEPQLTHINDDEAANSILKDQIKRKQPKGDLALSKVSDEHIEANKEAVTTYLQTKANKTRFNNFVKHQRLNREKDKRITQKIKETSRAPPATLEEIEKDPDLGMDYKVKDPKFELGGDVDPLYVEKPIDKYEPTASNLNKIRQKKSETVNRIVKKKFKAEPTTQSELRDCQVDLTGEQLQKVSAGPQKINFKNVFVKSQTVRSFNVSNDLRQNIYVRLMVDQYPELQQSTPLSQVIPPGQEAGFDIVFCSQKVKTFNAPITYYINDRPFNFLVQAQADPVSLELSKKVLHFGFSDESMEMSVTQSLTVTNYGNAPAKFSWHYPSKVFIPYPVTDTVDAGSSKTVQITFNPPGPKCDDELLLLKIQDGDKNDEELRCKGSVLESRCVFLEKQLDFGNVHIGLKAKDQTIYVRNQMRTPAIFHVVGNSDELSIYPLKGKILGDSKQGFTVGFQSNSSKDFNTEILVNIRGGKQLRIPVRAKAIVPDISIEETQIDFAGVTLGDHKTMPITIINNSDITAKLELDIRDYPEFEIILPDANADDDVHSEIMEPIHEHQKYEDIEKLDLDEVDPLDENEQDEDEDSVYDEDAKRHVTLSIRSTGRPFIMQLKYMPQSVDDLKNFVFPLKLKGFGELKGLTRRVRAVGQKPRFFLEPNIVNFKTKVIAKGQKPLPFHSDITISNPDSNPVHWKVDKDALDASKVYQMNPTEGTLEPTSTLRVRVTFNPHEPTEYVAKIPLYLDNDTSKPYLIIEFRGEGADAKIYFDRREIILPPVPLDIETKATFLVCHNGYENQELRCKIANEVGKLPIDITFPDGKNLGVTKQKVKVEATFKFSTPLSFTTFVDFFDDEGNKFSIPISGTTDNSIFTVYSFLQRHADEICFRVEPNKPIKLDQSVVTDMESAKTNFGGGIAGRAFSKGASSVVSRTARSLVGYTPVRSDILERNCEFVARWFNNMISANLMENFPAAVVQQNGGQIFELISFLSGKKPPGQATPKALAAANNSNAKDALKILINQYEELINFLKVNGAHLNTVRPEYLLSSSDYSKFLKMYPREENAKPKTLERFFHHVSMESWITLFYQVLKIYYLNRITPKNFKNLPGVPAHDSQVDSAMSKSNVYSVSETILLKWMAFHYNQMNPMHPRILTNFDADLQDCTVFAALIKSHYGDPNSLKDFRSIVHDTSQAAHNAKRIVQAVDEIGISTHIKPADIAEPSARELLLFCVQLYQGLPHYIPKAQIEFPAVLGDLVTKNIELSNPSKTPISYWVKLVGSPDFSVEEQQVKIDPGSTISFPVRFQSRISTVVKGKVIFTNKKEGNVQAAAMVFELVSNVYERNSVEIIQKSTKIYKALQIDLHVENAFNSDVLFNVHILYERNDKKGAGPKGKQAGASKGASTKGGKAGDKNAAANQLAAKDPKSSSPVVPEPYYCKQEQLKIKKGNQGQLSILFLPFELGIHKCHVIFTDENVGEVQYTIIGKADLPEILDTFTGDCNSEEPFGFKKVLNFKNEKLEQARNQIAEKEKKEHKGKKDVNDNNSHLSTAHDNKKSSAASNNQPKDLSESKLFEIEISNPFFSGPNTITLHDLTAPKLLAQQAQARGTKGKNDTSDYTNQFNLFELNCNPAKPASYTCYVILKSLDRTDIRLYEYKLTAIPQKIKAQLEFRVPARESVTQNIPIQNNSSTEWKVVAHLNVEKGSFFSLANQTTQKTVKKDIQENFGLVFKPLWVCQQTGTLTLKNESTKEEYEYELKGIGEEPLAVDHVILNCAARETTEKVFKIDNITDKAITYTVWTDLQNAVGTKEFTIKPKSSYEYKLAITPLLGGVYTASITFQDSDEKFQWYTVEVRTDSPKPEAVIDLRAFIRKATSAEISLSNPLNEPITFEVFYQGEGLLGDSTFSLEPKSIGTYNMIFSPLLAGEFQGNIGFLNEKVGEFWYDLNLIAEENPIVNLDLLECELGKMAHHYVELENPTGKELFLDYRNTNPTNFEVNPDKIILPPYETVKVQIQYSPTNLDVVETASIVFENNQIGKWEFNMEGQGKVPTIMEPQPISTAVGSNTSSMLSFKNPFKESASVSVHMEGDENKIFSLLLKRNKFNIGPLGILQIPYSFSPDTMTESKASIIVSMSKQLVWKYPLRGIAESASTQIDFYFRTRARRPFEDSLKINLPGFSQIAEDDSFRFEINVPNEAQKGLIDRSVFIDQTTDKITNSDDPIVFDLRFEPLRPFKAQTELCIYKSSGGRWKFNVIFEALEPEVDDVIIIQSPLHKTSSVSFKLTNHMKTFADFHAYFTSDSAAEFQVHPKSGLLEPYGKEGTNFIVSFTPTEYGKAKIGRLIIQTEEMQWTYEIRGSHPQYKIPTATGGRIQNKLTREQQQVLSVTKQSKKNFLRENLRATQHGSSPSRNQDMSLSKIKKTNSPPREGETSKLAHTRGSRDTSPTKLAK